MKRIRTKKGFEQWKLLLEFMYNEEPKGFIDENNYINLYNEDWNVLMELVEKIENNDECTDVTFSINGCNITRSRAYFGDKTYFSYGVDKDTKIEAVYCACVEFVKWNKKNK